MARESLLLRVELRKLFDTRSSFWVITLLGLMGVGIAAWAGLHGNGRLSFASTLAATQLFFSLLASIVGMLGMCGDWTHRDAVNQWPLVRRRSAMFRAKIAACGVVGLLAYAVQMAAVMGICLLRAATGRDVDYAGALSNSTFALGLILLGVLFGCGVAGIVRRMPLAIGLILVLHVGVNLSAGFFLPAWLQGAVSTLSPMRFFTPEMPVGLGAATVSFLLWYVLPVALAGRIYARAEL